MGGAASIPVNNLVKYAEDGIKNAMNLKKHEARVIRVRKAANILANDKGVAGKTAGRRRGSKEVAKHGAKLGMQAAANLAAKKACMIVLAEGAKQIAKLLEPTCQVQHAPWVGGGSANNAANGLDNLLNCLARGPAHRQS